MASLNLYFISAFVGIFGVLAFGNSSLLFGIVIGCFATIIIVALVIQSVFLNSEPDPLSKSSELREEPEVANDSTETETCAWFNQLLSKVVLEHLLDQNFTNRYHTKIREAFSKVKKPNFIGSISVPHVDFGSSTLKIPSGIKTISSKESGELSFEFDITYEGKHTFNMEVKIDAWIHFPKEYFAKIPFLLHVHITYIKGRALMKVPSGRNPLCTISFVKEPITNVVIQSQIGGTRFLKNIPKVSEFIVSQIKKVIREQLMSPNGLCFHLPIAKERKLKVRLLSKVHPPQVDRASKPREYFTLEASNENSTTSGTSNNLESTPSSPDDSIHVSETVEFTNECKGENPFEQELSKTENQRLDAKVEEIKKEVPEEPQNPKTEEQVIATPSQEISSLTVEPKGVPEVIQEVTPPAVNRDAKPPLPPPVNRSAKPVVL